MKQRIREARSSDEGFTLIELLIVIVVLGVLSGITVFGVATFRGDSEEAACKATVKTISVAADAYSAKSPTGAYPTMDQLVAGKYIKAAPPASPAITIDGTAKTVTGACNPSFTA